jgi:hypothetical protein
VLLAHLPRIGEFAVLPLSDDDGASDEPWHPNTTSQQARTSRKDADDFMRIPHRQTINLSGPAPPERRVYKSDSMGRALCSESLSAGVDLVPKA